MPRPDSGRVLGSLAGLAVCEALAASGDQIPAPDAPLPTGLWGDGTSMALSLAESLGECDGVDQRDQMIRYTSWFRYGHMSSGETCAFIDEAVRQATLRFERTWNPEDETRTQGDVCLARVAPVAIYFSDSREAVLDACARATRTTHSGPQSVDACLLLAAMVHEALSGSADRERVLAPDMPHALSPEVAGLNSGAPRSGDFAACTSLGAALEAFREGKTFAEGCRLCLPHGPRAMAAYGQLAGAWHGSDAIPQPWLRSLARFELIEKMSNLLIGK